MVFCATWSCTKGLSKRAACGSILLQVLSLNIHRVDTILFLAIEALGRCSKQARDIVLRSYLYPRGLQVAFQNGTSEAMLHQSHTFRKLSSD